MVGPVSPWSRDVSRLPIPASAGGGETMTPERMMAAQREARRRWPLGRGMLLDTAQLDEGTGRWSHWANPAVVPGHPRQRPRGAQTWQEMLNTILADGVQISNSTAEARICPDFSIPAYYMAAGRVLRVTAGGKCSN